MADYRGSLPLFCGQITDYDFVDRLQMAAAVERLQITSSHHLFTLHLLCPTQMASPSVDGPFVKLVATGYSDTLLQYYKYSYKRQI